MIGLSTAWRSAEANSGKELLDYLTSLGVGALELEYRVTPEMLKEMIPLIKERSISVLSIHNFCPIPDNVPRHKAGADVFLLSSAHKEERAQAIKYSLKTMQLAHDLEVEAVVFHLGHVDMTVRKERFFDLFDKGEIDSIDARNFIEEELVSRRKARQKNLDSVLFSLERLNKDAEKLNVFIGVENRYNYHEIPDFEEIGIILKEFSGGRIRYWHDVGHAAVLQQFGILKHEELLLSYSSNLLGMHIHDLKGYDDHYAPGTGEFDYDRIKKYLNPNVIKIMEVHPKVSREETLEGFKFLRSKGID